MDYSFGSWVRKRRKALDLTQQELAVMVGCSPSLVFKIEAEERRPSRQIAKLLAENLEIPPEQHDLFLKIARQEKSTLKLDDIPPAPATPIVTAPQKNSDNLPIPATPLVGREHEISAITSQLHDPACRMLTLTGPGGIGKTRLAIEAGRQLKNQFKDGVFFVPLIGINMTESIIPGMAAILGLSFSGPAEPIAQLTTFLHSKDVLLVIDNMEHLIEGAGLLGEILQNTQQAKMLVTSREQLRLQWEWLFDVQGLPIPENTDANFQNSSAVSLFLQRAQQAFRNYSMEAEDAEAIIRICKLVDGLPLAIELAASWVRFLSCREIAQELEQDLDLLKTQKLDVPPRHRSIKTVLKNSWEMLTGEERTILKRLSVFQGGFMREAAITVAEANLSVLTSLMEKSLLRFNRSNSRYGLHEMVRQFALSQLQADQDELIETSENHASYFAHWISSLEGPFKSEQQAITRQLIRSETSNWEASWHWAVEYQKLDILRKMSPCLNWYFEVHGYYDEALSLIKFALDSFSQKGAPASLQAGEDRSAFAFLMDQVGWFEFRKGNVKKGISLLAESLEIARQDEDPEILYYIYVNWGYLSLMNGDFSEAERLTTESLNYGRMLTPWHTAIPISMLGIVAYQQGNLTQAYQKLTDSLEIWRSVGDPRGLVFCMLYLGMTTFALNEIDETRSILRESNALAEANMDRWAQGFGMDMLGMVALSQGQNEEALEYFTESIRLYREISDQLNATQTIIHLGQAHAALQSLGEAKHLFLEAYATAQESKWTLVILSVLVSFAELPGELSPDTRLAAALSVTSHPSITPHLLARCESLRDQIMVDLTPEQIETAGKMAKQKSAEEWAQELLE